MENYIWVYFFKIFVNKKGRENFKSSEIIF